MSFGLVIKSGIKMLFWWVIGLLLILFGIILGFNGLSGGFSNLTNKGIVAGMYITLFIAFIICVIGVLIIWYFGNKHNIRLNPGYVSRSRHFNY